MWFFEPEYERLHVWKQKYSNTEENAGKRNKFKLKIQSRIFE